MKFVDVSDWNVFILAVRERLIRKSLYSHHNDQTKPHPPASMVGIAIGRRVDAAS